MKNTVKKTPLFVLCAVLLAVLTGCGEKEPEAAEVTASISITEAVEIYSGENLWDGGFGEDNPTVLVNNANNPGAVAFTVWVISESGQPDILSEPPVEIAPGESYESPQIASSYDKLEITAQAVDEKGEYKLTYSYPAN